jgi:hypothetical protein
MPIRSRALRVACLVLSALVLSGCGPKPKLVPVTGQVVHKGRPLTAGSIWLHPSASNPYQGEKPSCQLALDGAFVLRTYPYGEGVPPGSYKVSLSPELANRIKLPAYGDSARTPLKLDVPEEGIKDVVFVVK